MNNDPKPDEFRWFVGIDWATEAHQVCILDVNRRVVDERSIQHTAAAIGTLVDRLTELADKKPHEVAVAIEVPRGAVVETLLERGFVVFAINPKQLDRFRDRHTVAGAKDDRRDAFVLADSVRTDQPCFRRLTFDEPLVIRLREMSRADDDLRADMNRATNRLREQVYRYFPQALGLCPSADEPWFWALLELCPSTDAAVKIKVARMAKLLSDHRIRRVSADQVLATCKTAAPYVAPGTAEAAIAHVQLLVPRLRLLHEQRRDCGKAIDDILAALAAPPATTAGENEHRDVDILLSLPGVGRIVAATMLAEASRSLAERDYSALRAHAGLAPITRQSGKRKTVIMRQGCNGRLRNACYHWARTSTQGDPGARAHYARLREAGHSHGRALRSVADRLLRILVAMLKSHSVYDPARFAPRVPPAPAGAATP